MNYKNIVKKAEEVAAAKKNFSCRMESGKMARSFAWTLMSKLGIKTQGISIYKRGRYYISSSVETELFDFHHDAESKHLVITFHEDESVIPAHLVGRVNKLLPKSVVKAFEKQGDTSQKEMKDIKIICKLFNPYGGGTWYLYEHIEDDVYMCFANLGDPTYAEMGTVSIVELAELTKFAAPMIERDRSFESGKHTLEYVYNKVKNGGHV